MYKRKKQQEQEEAVNDHYNGKVLSHYQFHKEKCLYLEKRLNEQAQIYHCMQARIAQLEQELDTKRCQAEKGERNKERNKEYRKIQKHTCKRTSLDDLCAKDGCAFRSMASFLTLRSKIHLAQTNKRCRSMTTFSTLEHYMKRLANDVSWNFSSMNGSWNWTPARYEEPNLLVFSFSAPNNQSGGQRTVYLFLRLMPGEMKWYQTYGSLTNTKKVVDFGQRVVKFALSDLNQNKEQYISEIVVLNACLLFR